jgi:hypothetical protein
LIAIGEQHLEFDGTLLDRWGQVFNGHHRQRRTADGIPEIESGSGREARRGSLRRHDGSTAGWPADDGAETSVPEHVEKPTAAPPAG